MKTVENTVTSGEIMIFDHKLYKNTQTSDFVPALGSLSKILS